MSSYLSLSSISNFSVKGVAEGVASAALLGVTVAGLYQIGVVFHRGISYGLSFAPKGITENEFLKGWKTTITDKLGTLFVSTDAYQAKHTKDVHAKDKDGKDTKEFAARTGDYKISNTSLLLSGVTLCLVALAAFKLMSSWRAGDSSLNKVLTYFTPVQMAPSAANTAFNTLGNAYAGLKTWLF